MMGRAVVHIALFGLLLALVTTSPNKDNWDVYSFHINSTVTSRYATTVITSRVANRMNESKEIEFQVRIPKNAFISKFRMFMDGQVYDGVVKTKEQAQQQYAAAVSRGQSAGLVSSVGRTLEEFKTSVTVAAHKKVTFELTYEELLKRRLGKYELQIHARPMQPVKDFKVDVYIHEKAGISFMEVKGGLSTKALANAITKTQTDKQAWVYFYPTESQQKTCDSCGEQGMNGDLVVVYDVNRDVAFGDIKTSSGYFVHHFAPSSLPRIPKNVVFVIDQSGSMYGRKIQQTRTALIHILSDLAEDDYFGLITFAGNIFHWKRELVQATKENVNSAKNFAENIQESGSTDINAAVLEGAHILKAHPREGSASILILLTDGDPTSGVRNPETIQSNVRKAIADSFPLYCLGFGFDVHFEFLEKLSLQNNGVARRIYEDSDADSQLKGFYEEVATPLLMNVMMMYTGGSNLTQTHFTQYYNGSEIVVAGQITDNDIENFTPEVRANSGAGSVRFSDTNPPTVESNETVSDSRLQRVWAYLTVKQLLDKAFSSYKKKPLLFLLATVCLTNSMNSKRFVCQTFAAENQGLQLSGPENHRMREEALELSLKYSFVTPLTSMVVTKPEGEKVDVLHKPKEGEMDHSPVAGGSQLQLPSLARADSYYDAYVDANEEDAFLLFDVGPPPVYPSVSSAPVRVLYRFLIKSENRFLPLCFDIPGGTRLKLLHHPSEELSVIGLLDSEPDRGFKTIVIHLKNNQVVEILSDGTFKQQVQGVTHFSGGGSLVSPDITVIGRDKDFDVAVGDARMIILIHEVDGNKFLWPVLRQKPSDSGIDGILALKPAVYKEVQQSPSTTLKIRDQEIGVTRSTAVDYSISTLPTLDCWFMSAESALQRRLDDFTVANL